MPLEMDDENAPLYALDTRMDDLIERMLKLEKRSFAPRRWPWVSRETYEMAVMLGKERAEIWQRAFEKIAALLNSQSPPNRGKY